MSEYTLGGTGLRSYDVEAREAVETVSYWLTDFDPVSATELAEGYAPPSAHTVPWPVDGDELTKRGMK